jgi:hypothetical protein
MHCSSGLQQSMTVALVTQSRNATGQAWQVFSSAPQTFVGA